MTAPSVMAPCVPHCTRHCSPGLPPGTPPPSQPPQPHPARHCAALEPAWPPLLCVSKATFCIFPHSLSSESAGPTWLNIPEHLQQSTNTVSRGVSAGLRGRRPRKTQASSRDSPGRRDHRKLKPELGSRCRPPNTEQGSRRVTRACTRPRGWEPQTETRMVGESRPVDQLIARDAHPLTQCPSPPMSIPQPWGLPRRHSPDTQGTWKTKLMTCGRGGKEGEEKDGRKSDNTTRNQGGTISRAPPPPQSLSLPPFCHLLPPQRAERTFLGSLPVSGKFYRPV